MKDFMLLHKFDLCSILFFNMLQGDDGWSPTTDRRCDRGGDTVEFWNDFKKCIFIK